MTLFVKFIAVCVYFIMLVFFIYVGPPFAANYLYEEERCLTDFTISWDPVASDPVCGPVSYNVTVSSSNGVMITVTTNGISYNFTELTPDNNYTVTVVGRNDVGVGGFSVRIINTATMTEATPSGMCVDIFPYFHKK